MHVNKITNVQSNTQNANTNSLLQYFESNIFFKLRIKVYLHAVRALLYNSKVLLF